MDEPGTSNSTATDLCKLCNVNRRVYTCPRCGIGYCTVDCYKSEAHLDCSESFYKQCVEEELKSQENDPVSRQKMVEVLKRLHEEEDLNINFLSNEDTIDEEEEQLDSDDEEDVPDLAERLQNIDLDNADEVWTALTDSERQEFEALIKNGEVEKLLPQWIPWWTCKIRPVMEIDQGTVEYVQKCPALIDVPIFNELQKASPNVYFNLVNVIYAYAYMAHYYNGDYLNCAEEAATVFLNICDNMKTNKVHDSTESAIESVVQGIINCQWLPQEKQILLDFKESASKIIQGPEESNKSFYISVALSELHRLLTAAKGEITKQRKTDKQFAKIFVNRINSNDTILSRKTVQLCCKKLEYYLSWIKSTNKFPRKL